MGSKEFSIYFLSVHRDTGNSHTTQHHLVQLFNSTQHPLQLRVLQYSHPCRKSLGETKCITPLSINFLSVNDVIHTLFHDISQMLLCSHYHGNTDFSHSLYSQYPFPLIYFSQEQIDPQSFIIIITIFFIIIIYTEHPLHTNSDVGALHEISLHQA